MVRVSLSNAYSDAGNINMGGFQSRAQPGTELLIFQLVAGHSLPASTYQYIYIKVARTFSSGPPAADSRGNCIFKNLPAFGMDSCLGGKENNFLLRDAGKTKNSFFMKV